MTDFDRADIPKVITLGNVGAIEIRDGEKFVYCDDLGCIGEESMP